MNSHFNDATLSLRARALFVFSDLSMILNNDDSRFHARASHCDVFSFTKKTRRERKAVYIFFCSTLTHYLGSRPQGLIFFPYAEFSYTSGQPTPTTTKTRMMDWASSRVSGVFSRLSFGPSRGKVQSYPPSTSDLLFLFRFYVFVLVYFALNHDSFFCRRIIIFEDVLEFSPKISRSIATFCRLSPRTPCPLSPSPPQTLLVRLRGFDRGQVL